MGQKEFLYRYLKPSRLYCIGRLYLAPFLSAIGIPAMVQALATMEYSQNMLTNLTVVALLLGCIASFVYIAYTSVRARIMLRSLKSDLDAAFADPIASEKIKLDLKYPIYQPCRGNVLLGKEYIFGRYSCCLTKYTDIERIYEVKHHETSASNYYWAIACRLHRSKYTYYLAPLLPRGRSGSDVKTITQHIKWKNPQLITGKK